MNSIPSGFDEHQISQTIIGGVENYSNDSLNISVILLNSKGSQFKQNIFDNLLQCNFRSIVSIEPESNNFAIDQIISKYPTVKFIIPHEKVTDGELINLAMGEVKAEYVLVLRDTLYIPSGIILTNLAERLTKDKLFCIVPRLLDNSKNAVYCQFSPEVEKNKFLVVPSKAVEDGKKTIFPYDNIALYNRKKFINLGGFDYTIKNSYWQKLDFGIRSWLWGEETRITTLLQFSYIDENPVEDKTINLDYLRYYLKNEVPKIKLDQGIIRSLDFAKFHRRSSCGFLEARRQFKEAKKWVFNNRFKFKMSLETLVQTWGENNEN